MKIPLHRQLTTAFRDAILSGKLQPGERVSSSRELQVEFGVSRNTALNALGQLQSEGFLTTVRGSGTFVADVTTRSKRACDEAASVASSNDAVPFRPGIPAPDCLPPALFKRNLDSSEWTNERLRAAIVRRLQQTRAVVCSPDQVFVVPSTRYAISLIGRVLLKPGDEVVLEDPGCPKVRSTLLALGANIVPIGVDDEGINVDSFARRRAALAYVTPSHQFPSGAPLSLERRYALLRWAAAFGAWIVENDYDGDFNYARRHHQTALQGLDEGRHVLYLGTLSRVLSPSIRIAYMIAPRSLCPALKAAHQANAGYVSPILQAAVAAFIERGHFARHVAKMRAVYDERRRFLSAALGNAGVHVRDWGAGLHFVADLPPDLPDVQVSAKAAEGGIEAPALSSYFYGPPAMNGLVLGFAATPVPAARVAVEKLLKAL